MSDDQHPSDPESTRAESGGDATRQDGGSPGDSSTAKRLGDFELIREIGRGGMGVVYEALKRQRQEAAELLGLN